MLAFLAEVVGEPAVIVGNSIGSLACVMTAAAAPEGALRGVGALPPYSPLPKP